MILTLVGLRETDTPVGETEEESDTVPAKPFKLVSVIVDVAEDAELKVRLAGLLDIVKSGVGVPPTVTV